MKDKNIYSKNSKIIIKVSIITIIINFVLTAAKLVSGLLLGNLSVISDAVHSGSDLATSFLIIFAVFVSSPKSDKEHNYGHEKVESLITLFLSLILGGLSLFLIWEGIAGILSPMETEFNFYLTGVTVLSIIVKEAMFWYEIHYAKKIKSDMLKADAWHSRSDSLSSVAVLIGLLSVFFMETNIIESIAVLVVAVMIIKVAFGIFKTAVNKLIDKAASEEVCAKIKELAMQTSGVNTVDRLQTRGYGNTIYVDIEIGVDGNLSVDESHSIAQSVHDVLESSEELQVKHCNVHVNPSKKAD